MKWFLGIAALVALAIFIRDNSVHYVWKGLVAAWPLLLLVGFGFWCLWQGLGLKRHEDFRTRDSVNWSHHHGDPLRTLKRKADEAGVDLKIKHWDD